jgi:serine protein kinase
MMIVPDSKQEAGSGRSTSFIDDLATFASHHTASRWRGTFAEFLETILPENPTRQTRSSHQYLYDMLCWYQNAKPKSSSAKRGVPTELFTEELFGINPALERVVEYFKAASAGSDVGRRLLLLLGPPSGGKSSMVILIKRALEEYSHTDEGALYALQGSPVHESPLNLIPASMRPQFRETYGVDVNGELSPHSQARLDDGSVDLSKVAEVGDEGDPRAWSWSGAVYAASRGVLEMIEILKVKREFLYLLLTLTQEKNVKVSRFPLIHLDETILAHTNLAEFNRFLQEKENEALLDRMVIIRVPYTLCFNDESRIYKKLVSNAPAFREAHLDPHVLQLASVFSILTRLVEPEREGLDLSKKVRLYAGEDVDGFTLTDVPKLKAESPEEGMDGVSPRFVINSISNAITRSDAKSLTSMEMLLALKDSIEHDARMDAAKKKQWVDFLVIARKDFYNRWVKEDVHRALFASFEGEAQQLLEKYLDEVEASLDQREVTDPITGETRPADERFLRSVEEKIKISDSGKQSFRQEVVRKAMVAFKSGEKFTLDSHSRLHEAIEQYLFEERRDVLRLVTSAARPDDEAAQKISAVQERLVKEYGYDDHSAREALNYVTSLLSQE